MNEMDMEILDSYPTFLILKFLFGQKKRPLLSIKGINIFHNEKCVSNAILKTELLLSLYTEIHFDCNKF